MPKLEQIWKATDIQYLKDNYPGTTYVELAKTLGRSMPAIRFKILDLKAKREIDYIKKPINGTAYKIWLTQNNEFEYLTAISKDIAIETFLKAIKDKRKVVECYEHEAQLICQESDIRRTKHFYKFIK